MVQLLRISEETSLEGLERDFQLQRNDDPDFFEEWRQELVNLSQGDRDALKRITEFYKNISRKSVVSENIVKMAILSPLLDLAGFYSSQFAIADEESITISAIDGETIYRGRIDILVIQQSLWILVIESKSSSFSLHKALPQALAYMLASPNPAKTTFGLITNGSEYRFVKLDATGNAPIYATSSLFSIFPPDDDLPTVLQILRRLAQIIAP
ncbi:MAG: type I restriction enzyme HsdR N-terminal domain-containing protein [Pseudanabaena sp. ELA748]